MQVLIIGAGGGREHAIGWKLAKSPKVSKIYFNVGNAGTEKIGVNLNIKGSQEIIEWVKKNPVNLAAVISEDHLAAGVVDELLKLGIKTFGSTKLASEIESSKAFSKKLMQEKGIPTARAETFNDFKRALDYVKSQNFPLVVKASGLALGKGVLIAQNLDETKKFLKEIMIDKKFGDSGNELVIEEFLTGQEVSIHVFCDGKNYSIFPSSQDHKQIFDKDLGPNTGGMGTIAPVPWVSKELIGQIEKEIIIPTLEGLRKKGRKFKGVLYPGIMVTKDGPKVLEFNARFGDPETQSFMRLLKTDLLDIFMSCIDGTLNKINIEWEKEYACCIVLASGGYPEDYKKGFEISGLTFGHPERLNEGSKDVIVFHSGTQLRTSNPGLEAQIQSGIGKLVTNGGRVLGVSAKGKTLEESLEIAYNGASKIHFEGMHYRRDIGKRHFKF